MYLRTVTNSSLAIRLVDRAGASVRLRVGCLVVDDVTRVKDGGGGVEIKRLTDVIKKNRSIKKLIWFSRINRHFLYTHIAVFSLDPIALYVEGFRSSADRDFSCRQCGETKWRQNTVYSHHYTYSIYLPQLTPLKVRRPLVVYT